MNVYFFLTVSKKPLRFQAYLFQGANEVAQILNMFACGDVTRGSEVGTATGMSQNMLKSVKELTN